MNDFFCVVAIGIVVDSYLDGFFAGRVDDMLAEFDTSLGYLKSLRTFFS